MKLKKTLVMVLAACLLIGTLAGTAMADGTYQAIPNPDGQTYTVIPTPEPYTGWNLTPEGNWQYIVNNELQYHWQYIDGAWYYFAPETSYMVQRGVRWIENRLYVFGADGACVTNPGWYAIPTYFYVYDKDGKPAPVYPGSGVAYFYLNQNGYIQTGWNYIDGYWYMCDKQAGYMLSNQWYCGEGKYWYYFDAEGRMVTGWQTVKGNEVNKTYYFNGAGVLQWGWLNLDGNWYYLSDLNAARLENCWAKIDGFWYLFDQAGVMQTGWKEVVANPEADAKEQYTKWYYLYPWGAMAIGDQYINGVHYVFSDVEDGTLGVMKGHYADGKFYPYVTADTRYPSYYNPEDFLTDDVAGAKSETTLDENKGGITISLAVKADEKKDDKK